MKSGAAGVIEYSCRLCNTKRCAAYRATPNGRTKTRLAVYRSIAKHPERQRARENVRQAILRGELKRPTKCTGCHKRNKVEGHHKDYSKPLMVMWLCRPCHADMER